MEGTIPQSARRQNDKGDIPQNDERTIPQIQKVLLYDAADKREVSDPASTSPPSSMKSVEPIPFRSKKHTTTKQLTCRGYIGRFPPKAQSTHSGPKGRREPCQQADSPLPDGL